MKGDMYLAKSTDKEILKKAEHGGAVTSILKFALENRLIDGVVTVKSRNGNRYDGIPVLISNPSKLIDSAGALHCVTVNIPRFIKEYLDGAVNMKLAVVCKPCDARAIIELVKREQINIENIILIGINCTGTLKPTVAKEMLIKEYEVEPDKVVKEDIDDNKLTIILDDGTKKEKDLKELEEKGYGRRDNCRRCEVNIPTMADVACGKWGVKEGEKKTFVEICSKKGAELVDKAVKAGYIEVKKATEEAIKLREEKDREAIEDAHKQQEKDFAFFEKKSSDKDERFNYWQAQFNQCIKCFGCRDACPICYCKECYLEADRGVIKGGEVPPEILFPMIRTIHVADSCINCGQCEDVCPSEIPISQLVFYLSKKLSAIFKYEPGMDATIPPPLATITDKESAMEGVEIAL